MSYNPQFLQLECGLTINRNAIACIDHDEMRIYLIGDEEAIAITESDYELIYSEIEIIKRK